MVDFTPYSTATKWIPTLPQYISADDMQRIGSYTLYEEMYWGHPGAFELTQLGTDDDPIYVPSARTIVEAIMRYLCVDWDFYVDPNQGDEATRAAALVAFTKLFKREEMQSKFLTQLRYGLIRGDAMFHVVADPAKPQGSRISIHELDPASYFPIYDIDDLDKLVGVHIVDVVTEDDTDVIRRQTYRKEQDSDGAFTGVITSEIALFELTGWDDRNGRKPEDIKQVSVIQPETPLPSQITSIPVYHWRNIANPADPFGSSQLRGIERLAAAINQTISDEDLAIALSGLGVYTTDSKAPVDDDGNDTSWVIGPGRVIELSPGTNFSRVQGITSIQPSQDHVKYLEAKMKEGAGVPDVAIGNVEVQAAESGIALAIRLSPILAANKEKSKQILGVMDQFFYDLQTMWFPAYEGLNLEACVVTSVVADPMPMNRDAEIARIIEMATSTPPIITLDEARAELNKLGYSFPGEAAPSLYEQANRLASANDPFSGRLVLDGADDGTSAAE